MLNPEQIQQFIHERWQSSIVPALCDYIRIPNVSPAYEADWQQKGEMDKAIHLLANWCERQGIAHMTMQIHRLPGRTPLLMLEIPGNVAHGKTVLLYGHLDKQPEMTGWREGLGPWQPVIEGDRLYGRGGADDGYAVFAALTAIKALQQHNLSHGRCVVLIEACEESGSYDLPFYIDHLAAQIGTPDLVICLDSGCGNYDQLWVTTSLRGIISGVLKIAILTEGIHSGAGSGIVPTTFRILRQLLSRIENESNGEILLTPLHVTVPPDRLAEAKQVAATLGEHVWCELPFIEGATPASDNMEELVLDRTWRPKLTLTGLDGLPSLEKAGNVLRPEIAVMLSMRIPPTCDADNAIRALQDMLEKNPPYHAQVTFTPEQNGAGWNAPSVQPWLRDAAEKASHDFFGKSACYWGEGGSIPFMGMLGKKFPQAQFMITGVLGPQSNAHGPNEFLHVPYAEKITACVASILWQHAQQK